MPIDNRKIPTKILLPHALEARERLNCDPDKWSLYECGAIRSACGAEWSTIPEENIKLQCSNLRKAGRLGKVKGKRGHGATKREQPPKAYLEYLESNWWKAFRLTVLAFWDHSCALCNSTERLDVHHRTYARLHRERLNDCICLCRKCHQMAERARQRELKTNRPASLFLN